MSDIRTPSQVSAVLGDGLYRKQSATLGFTLGSISSVIRAFVAERLRFDNGFTYIAVVKAFSILPSLIINDTGT